MKIRLISQQRVLVPAGTEIDVDDGRAALLIEIGAAELMETAEAETIEKPKRVSSRKAKG